METVLSDATASIDETRADPLSASANAKADAGVGLSPVRDSSCVVCCRLSVFGNALFVVSFRDDAVQAMLGGAVGESRRVAPRA